MTQVKLNTDQLTFTRFVAAITIVIYHFGENVYPFNIGCVNTVVHGAGLGVSYFFMLSGLVMILAYGKRNKVIEFGSYIHNRIARIVPLYYLGLLLMLLYLFIRIQIMHMPNQYTPNITDFILNFLLIQSWVPGRALTMNVVAWSLSVEAFFYLIFPLVLNRFYLKFSTSAVISCIAIFFLISQVVFHLLLKLYPAYSAYFSNLPLLHVNSFFAGNALGIIFNSQPKIRARNMLIPIVFFFLITILALFFQVNGINYNDGLFIIYFLPLVFCMVLDNGPIARLFRKRALIYLGEISYGIYMLQFPVYFFFTALLTFIHHKINEPLFYVYLFILIIVSGISFQFIEKPLREKIKNWKY